MSNQNNDNKRPQKMTDKLFLHRSTQKPANSAKAFIEAHREFLMSGTLRPLTEPLLVKLDAGESLPTPTLDQIRSAVLQHMLDAEVNQGIQKIQQQQNGGSGEHSTSKGYLATIYDSNGNVCTLPNSEGEEKDLVKGFDDGEHAKDWVDRRLVEGKPDWHGEIVSTRILIGGEPWYAIVERSDSIARILRKKKLPVMYQRGKSTKSLSFGVKAKQDRASFSKG